MNLNLVNDPELLDCVSETFLDEPPTNLVSPPLCDVDFQDSINVSPERYKLVWCQESDIPDDVIEASGHAGEIVNRLFNSYHHPVKKGLFSPDSSALILLSQESTLDVPLSVPAVFFTVFHVLTR